MEFVVSKIRFALNHFHNYIRNLNLLNLDLSNHDLNSKGLGQECCSKIKVDVTNSDVRLRSVGGVYEYVGKTHGRDSFKHQTSDHYLFYISAQHTSGKARWVVENRNRITIDDKGYELYGYVRDEGNKICPSEVGQNWYHVWDTTKIDPSIMITCGKKNYIDIRFVYKCKLPNHFLQS